MKRKAPTKAPKQNKDCKKSGVGRPVKFPPHCASMKDCEAIFHLPVEMQKYARRQGCAAFAKNNSVDVAVLLSFFEPLLGKLFANEGARLKTLDEKEYLDPDEQLARQRKESADDQAMSNAVKAGRLVDQSVAESALWANGLSQVREAWLGYRSAVGPTLRSVMASLDPALVERVLDVAAAGVEQPLAVLQDSLKGKK